MKEKTEQRTGACRYCGQIGMIDVLEGTEDQTVDDLVSEQCNCAEARHQRKRRKQLAAANAWAEEKCGESEEFLLAAKSAIAAVFENKVDNVKIKAGKVTIMFDTDTSGQIRVRMSMKENWEETF